MLEHHFKPMGWDLENENLPKRAKTESAPGHDLDLKPKKAHFSKHGQNTDRINLFYHMKLIPYSKPKIYKNGKQWHIEYSFNIPHELQSMPCYAGKKRQRFKVYENLNRLQGEEKELFADYLRERIETLLINGYNPFEAIIELKNHLQEEKIKNEIKAEPLYTVLNKYIKAKIQSGISKKSIQSYQTPINHIQTWLTDKGWDKKPADHFTEEDIILYLNERATLKKWTAWTYNINREFAFMWFNWMEYEKIIPKSPLSKRLTKRIESGVSKNESYHGRIRDQVSAALKENPVIDRFCKLVYYTCTRPQEETLLIKIADINLKERTLKIYEQGKGGSRHIPICDELYDLLIHDFKINDYPLEYYLAGKNCLPSPIPVSKNYYSHRFLKIKTDLSIPNMYGIYSWKHTRINDLLSAGYSDAEVIQLTGHKGTESYDTYKRSVGKHLESKIKGKTVSF